jgi:hypothetical protein
LRKYDTRDRARVSLIIPSQDVTLYIFARMIDSNILYDNVKITLVDFLARRSRAARKKSKKNSHLDTP